MKKIIVKIKEYKGLTCICMSILLSLIIFSSYKLAINSQLNPVMVPTTNKYLSSGHKITKNDITYIELSKKYLLDGIYINEEEIINKYINSYNSLAQGSLFYKDILTKTDDIKDSNSFNLKEGEVAIPLDVDNKSTYANSILKGQNVDIYFEGDKDNNLIYGLLIKNARVIAVYDDEGVALDQNNPKDSAVIVLALDYDEADIFQKAKNIGNLLPIVSFDTLNSNQEHNYYDLSKMRKFIYSNTLDFTLSGEQNE